MCSIFMFIIAFSILNLLVSVYANQPIARFKNRTVGILADADAGVFIDSENVTITGDLEVKTTNKTVNFTGKVDLLASLQSDMELRIKYIAQSKGMGVICNPEGTEYRERNFETGQFGACVCRKGHTGDICLGFSPYGEDEWRDPSGLPDWDIFLFGDDYDGNSSKWKDEQSGYECTLGSSTTYNHTVKSFHFDYSRSSLIACPYNISPSIHSDLTIEIIFKLDYDYNPGSTNAWIVGHDNSGYDRSLVLSDNRYGGVGSGIGGTYTSGIPSPSVGIWHHGIATFRQGISRESFVAIDGVLGSKVTANNGNGKSEFTIGGLANYANHGIKGFVKGVRVFPVSFNDTLAELAWEEAKGFIDELNTGEATLSPSPSPSPPSLEEQCPISTSTADAGYADAYRGWYDASGCGICQDYCRWVGNSGAGGDPSIKTTHGTSWWSCRAAKGTSTYTGKTEYGSTFGFAKCSGQGATPP